MTDITFEALQYRQAVQSLERFWRNSVSLRDSWYFLGLFKFQQTETDILQQHILHYAQCRTVTNVTTC